VRQSGSGLHESTGVSRWGIHPPGGLYRCQNRVVAAIGFCIDMKTKGVVFCGVARDVIIENARGIARGTAGTGEEAFAIHKTFYHEGQGAENPSRKLA